MQRNIELSKEKDQSSQGYTSGIDSHYQQTNDFSDEQLQDLEDEKQRSIALKGTIMTAIFSIGSLPILGVSSWTASSSKMLSEITYGVGMLSLGVAITGNYFTYSKGPWYMKFGLPCMGVFVCLCGLYIIAIQLC